MKESQVRDGGVIHSLLSPRPVSFALRCTNEHKDAGDLPRPTCASLLVYLDTMVIKQALHIDAKGSAQGGLL